MPTAMNTNFEQYFFERSETTHVVCMDDRPLQDGPNGQVQIAGGGFGLAVDYIGASLIASGNRLPINHETADVYAGIIGKTIFANTGIRLGLHTECAAEKTIRKVMGFMASDDAYDSLLPLAKRDDLEINETTVELSLAAARTISRASILRAPEQAAHHMEHVAKLPLPRFQITDSPHLADTIIASKRRRVGFDTLTAWNDGNPAYHINFADLEPLTTAVQSIFTVNADHVRTFSTLRHLATAPELPVPAGADSLTLITR